MQKLTKTERSDVRHLTFLPGATHVEFWDNGDGTWAADVHGYVFEAASPAELLRDLVEALEEQ